MAWLTREQVKQIVTEALKEIADFTGDVEQYLISEIDDVYKPDFIGEIRQRVVDKGYDINLSINGQGTGINHMEDIGVLIDYIWDNQQREA